MKKVMEYQGYRATIEYDGDDEIFVGSVIGIADSLVFHGNSVDELRNMFHQSVDNYLIHCKEIGKEPEKEYKGTFNVRISPELHKKLALAAYKNGDTLNAAVEKAVKEYVLKEDKEKTDTMKDDFDSKKNLLGAVV